MQCKCVILAGKTNQQAGIQKKFCQMHLVHMNFIHWTQIVMNYCVYTPLRFSHFVKCQTSIHEIRILVAMLNKLCAIMKWKKKGYSGSKTYLAPTDCASCPTLKRWEWSVIFAPRYTSNERWNVKKLIILGNNFKLFILKNFFV